MLFRSGKRARRFMVGMGMVQSRAITMNLQTRRLDLHQCRHQYHPEPHLRQNLHFPMLKIIHEFIHNISISFKSVSCQQKPLLHQTSRSTNSLLQHGIFNLLRSTFDTALSHSFQICIPSTVTSKTATPHLSLVHRYSDRPQLPKESSSTLLIFEIHSWNSIMSYFTCLLYLVCFSGTSYAISNSSSAAFASESTALLEFIPGGTMLPIQGMLHLRLTIPLHDLHRTCSMLQGQTQIQEQPATLREIQETCALIPDFLEEMTPSTTSTRDQRDRKSVV